MPLPAAPTKLIDRLFCGTNSVSFVIAFMASEHAPELSASFSAFGTIAII